MKIIQNHSFRTSLLRGSTHAPLLPYSNSRVLNNLQNWQNNEQKNETGSYPLSPTGPDYMYITCIVIDMLIDGCAWPVIFIYELCEVVVNGLFF